MTPISIDLPSFQYTEVINDSTKGSFVWSNVSWSCSEGICGLETNKGILQSSAISTAHTATEKYSENYNFTLKHSALI